MSKVETINIEELEQDSRNFNKGTEEGKRLMEKSFSELGAGRSILIDRGGRIIAGNKSQQAAIAAGIKKVRVIETDGTELVAVKRTDIDIDSADGRRLALADNLTTQVNLSWDETELRAVGEDIPDFDVGDFGVSIDQLPGNPFDAKEPTGETTSQEADARDNKERQIHQRDPDSEIIVATVSLFGTTEDMMLTQTITTEDADKLIALAKTEGVDNLMKRIIAAL